MGCSCCPALLGRRRIKVLMLDGFAIQWGGSPRCGSGLRRSQTATGPTGPPGLLPHLVRQSCCRADRHVAGRSFRMSGWPGRWPRPCTILRRNVRGSVDLDPVRGEPVTPCAVTIPARARAAVKEPSALLRVPFLRPRGQAALGRRCLSSRSSTTRTMYCCWLRGRRETSAKTRRALPSGPAPR